MTPSSEGRWQPTLTNKKKSNMEIDWSAEEREARMEMEALDRQKKRREQEPLLYCKLVTRWPLRTFLLTLSAHLIMIIASAILLASGYDLLPLSFEDVPLHIYDRPWEPRGYAWQSRNDYPGYYDRTPTDGPRTQMDREYASIEVYYDAGNGGNIFTKASLEKMQEIENSVMEAKDYHKYCQLNSVNNNCTKAVSVLRYFDGTYKKVNPVLNDPGFENIPKVLFEALTNKITKKQFQFFLGTSYNITTTEATSWITRSIIPFGYPLENYENDNDGFRDILETYSAENVKPILEKYHDEVTEFDFSYVSRVMWIEEVTGQAMLDVRWAGASIGFIFFLILFHTRSLWITALAILSIIASFITTNLIYNLVLGFRYLGFFHILALFVVLGIGADDIFIFYDIWRNTACEKYPSLAHRLSDAYRKSVFSMLFTSLTTAVAFFSSAITSLLATRSFGIFSAVVIIVNYISIIVYFPTVVIMHHTYFEKFQWPCFFLWKKVCGKTYNSSDGAGKEESEPKSKYAVDNDSFAADENLASSISGTHRIEHSSNTYNGSIYIAEDNPDIRNITINDSAKNGTVYQGDIHSTWKGSREVFVIKHSFIDTEKDIISNNTHAKRSQNGVHRSVPKRLNNHDNSFDNTNSVLSKSPTTHKSFVAKQKRFKEVDDIAKTYKSQSKQVKAKKPLMVRFFRRYYFAFVTHRVIRWLILLVLLGILGFFIYQASTLEPDNELFNVLSDNHVFSKSNEHKLYSFVSSYGDETLVIYIVWGMLQNDMSECDFSAPKCEGKQVWDDSFNPNTVEAQLALKKFCENIQSISDMDAYDLRLRKDLDTGKYQVKCFIEHLDEFLKNDNTSSGQDWSLPYNVTKVQDFMQARSTFYNTSSHPENIFEIPISYWLSNKYSYQFTNDFYKFDALIGEQTGKHSMPIKTAQKKTYDNKIKYLAIEVNTTIKYRILGSGEGIPIMNKWEDFVSSEMANMPDGMKNGFQIDSRRRWRWLIVQELLVLNAIYGIAIGVSLAFPILVIATGNIITGILAAFSMCCSTVCVIGVIPLGGWKLGVIEALNMCMVVGLTVDYVVHLAEGYTLSLHKDRLSRVQDMLDEMAVSVFFGACTTLGASIFMFLAKLTFFFQFGIFIFSTVGFSLLFSMGMFVTLLGIFGPENDTGNVRLFCTRYCTCSKCCKTNDEGN